MVDRAARGPDIGIVGGGVGGLALAALLARRGHAVTLYERDRLGGKVRIVQAGDLTHSSGPSLWTFPGVWRAYLARLGAHDPLGHVQLPGLGEHHVRGERVPLPVPPGHPLHPHWARYEAEVAPLAGPMHTLLTTPPRLTDARFIRASAALGRVLGPHLSAQGWLAARRFPPKLQGALALHALNAGVGPRAGSALYALLPALIARDVWRIEGGAAQLVEALTTLALGLGVRLREGVPVTGLDPARAELRWAGGAARHGLLVSALDPERLAGLLGRPVPDQPRSVSGVVLCATLPQPSGLPPTTVVAPPDLAAFERDLGARRWPARSMALVHAEGRRLSVLLTAPPTGERLGLDHPWVQAQLAHLRREIGLPELGPAVAVLDPAHYAHGGAPGGAIYGRTHPAWRAGPLHPQPYRLAPRLWQVGAGVHPGGGLPAVLGGALIVDELLHPAMPVGRTVRGGPRWQMS